ncbi:MAG: ABC transporter permease [Deltaproteobacteria bacterium]|nr:ABC transporter permease [Deltaproteobacteria bacterium]
MHKIIVLAWRNLFRNKRRTLITMSAIAFGLALLVVSSAMGDGGHNQMIRYGVANQAGHLVVQGEGFQKERKVEILVPDTAEVVATAKRLAPDAKVVQRVFFDGLLTSPRSAVGVAMVGVEAGPEAEVGDLDTKIVEGRYLTDEDSQGIIIGTLLAEALEVAPGDKVVLMTQQNGDIQNVLFRVTGLFKTGMAELDGFYAHVPLKKAQEAFSLGTEVNQVSLHLPDPDDTDALALRLREALASASISAEVLPWQEALPELYEFILLDDGGMYVLILIIAIVVAFGILNTVLMSVLERTHELGVMLSLGMTPWQVAAMILTEAVLLGLISIVVGSGVGGLMAWPLIVNGIDVSEMVAGQGAVGAAGVPMDMMLYGELSAVKVVVFARITFGLTLLAALYPTWKAARLHPVEAIHHH